MLPKSSCPLCGHQLSEATAQGLCPKCLAGMVFGYELDEPSEWPVALGALRRFGDYELLEEIARGGMGVVYRARQMSLGREVAVKLLLQGALASADEVERFRAEAAAAGALKHPAIVAIHEVGQHEGQHYYSMDLIPGRDLANLTRDGPLPVTQAARLLVEISEALQHAHEQGVLHRDLKPSNIILDAEDRPHVTDFGLARRSGMALTLTQTGQALGTPGYMSPEQAAGIRQLGPATDIYSLGALLYHLLTGRAPFTGATPTTVLRQVEEQEPVSPRALNPSTPRDLETICLKCLAKEPARRYVSAEALRQDLCRFLGNESIQARPTGPIEQAWRWCRRRPALAGSIVGIVLLLLAITISSTISAYRIAGLHREVSVNLYAADMRLAAQAVAESKFGTAIELLKAHRPRHGEADPRGFEWRYLWNECRSDEIATLGRHSNQAQRVAFSPDGCWAATAATDVSVWDLKRLQLFRHFDQEAYVWGLAFSPDSHWLAAAFQDLALSCYDIKDGHEVRALTNLGITSLALNWDQDKPQKVRVIGSEQSIIWDPGQGSLTRQKGPHSVGRMALTSDGRLGAALRNNPWSLSLWDIEKMQRLNEVSVTNSARSVAISPDGQRVVTGGFSGAMILYDATTLKPIRTFNAHRGMIATVVFSGDGQLLASAGADEIIRIWDATNWTLINSLRGHPNVIFAVAFSPDQRQLISGDKDGEVKLWSIERKRNEGSRGEVSPAAISGDGSVLAVRDDKGHLRIGDPADVSSNLVDLTSLSISNAVPRTASRQGVMLSLGQGKIGFLQSDGKLAARELPAVAVTTPLLLSPDGAYLVYWTGDNGARVWDMAKGMPAYQMDLPRVTSVPAIAPDNLHIAFGFPNGAVEVFNLRNGKSLARFDAHKGFSYACDFSRDGRRLAVAGFDGTVSLFEWETARLIATFRCSADAFWTVALSADGRRIAAGTGDSTIVLWDVASGQQVGSFSLGEPSGPVEGQLRFTPRDDALVLTDGSGWHVWKAPQVSE